MAGGIGDILQSNIRQRFQPRQKLADALMQGAYDTSAVSSPWEALGRVLQGGLAGYAGRRVRDKETEAQKAATDTLSKALAGDRVDYNILGGNQDTAGLGLDLKVNDIAQRREMENQRALAAARASERNKFFDVEGGQRDSDGRFYPSENKGSGLFQGSGFDQQAINYMLDPKNDPSTPEYAAAYNAYSSPKTQIIDGAPVTTRNDVSAFRKPTFAGYNQQQNAVKPSLDNTQGQNNQGAQAVTGNPNITVGPKLEGLDKPLDAKTKSDASEILSAESAIKAYQDMLKTQGKSPFGQLIGDPKAVELGTRRQDLILRLKGIYNLGVLSDKDQAALANIVSDPNSFSNILVGNDALGGQINVLLEGLNSAKNNLIKTNPGAASLFEQNTQPNQQSTQPVQTKERTYDIKTRTWK